MPIFALNPASEERCEWLVPGMLKEKIVALAKTLPQRPRSRLVPLPEYADAFIAETGFGTGSLLDALAAHAAKRTGLPLRREDFKHEQLAPHLLMNLRVVDEHGRQLGESRRLAELKAALGAQARYGVPGARSVALADAVVRRQRRRDARSGHGADAKRTGSRRVADARRRPSGRRPAPPQRLPIRRVRPTRPGPSASCPS